MNAIETAAAECRKACANLKIGDTVQHIHHGEWLEILTEPIENRIASILTHKPEHERAERLRRMRPLSNADGQKAFADGQKAFADWQKADADWQKAFADWQKAVADWQKAFADWQKAFADWQKARADYQKAVRSPTMLALHAQIMWVCLGSGHRHLWRKNQAVGPARVLNTPASWPLG